MLQNNEHKEYKYGIVDCKVSLIDTRMCSVCFSNWVTWQDGPLEWRELQNIKTVNIIVNKLHFDGWRQSAQRAKV